MILAMLFSCHPLALNWSSIGTLPPLPNATVTLSSEAISFLRNVVRNIVSVNNGGGGGVVAGSVRLSRGAALP